MAKKVIRLRKAMVGTVIYRFEAGSVSTIDGHVGKAKSLEDAIAVAKAHFAAKHGEATSVEVD